MFHVVTSLRFSWPLPSWRQWQLWPFLCLKMPRFRSEFTIRTTRIITIGMTTKTAPGGRTKRKTTRKVTSFPGQTTSSNLNTGIGAIAIQIRTSQVATSDEATRGQKDDAPLPQRYRRGVGAAHVWSASKRNDSLF